jgi:hypothetical protein
MDLFDVVTTEAAEQQIDAFIEKRSREAKDADAIEALWAVQDRLARQRNREANRQAWIAFHRGLARSHAALSESHEARAASLAAGDAA